jgi:hypothetical protein
MQNRLLIIPIPVTIPPDFTSSFPYNSCPARADSYKKGLPTSSNFSILPLTVNFPLSSSFCKFFASTDFVFYSNLTNESLTYPIAFLFSI